MGCIEERASPITWAHDTTSPSLKQIPVRIVSYYIIRCRFSKQKAQDLGVAKRINQYEKTYTWELQSTNAGFVRLLTPTLGEVLEAGESYDIAWEASEDAARFSLLHSIDNGVTWSPIDGAENLTDTSFEWIVPLQPGNKKKCLVKLTGYYNDGGTKVEEDVSEPFTIEVVELISPNGGGEPLTSGISPIEWTVNETIRPVDSIQLFYTTDGGKKWKPVGPPLAGDATTHDWLSPTGEETQDAMQGESRSHG